MNENPESTFGPRTDDFGASTDIRLTSAAQQFLNQTRPWARFMSVVILAAAALMGVGGIVVSTIVAGLRAVHPVAGRLGTLGLVESLIVGLIYFLLAILYITPGVFLWRYAGAIRLLETGRSPQALEDALRNQKSFWRYVGILTVVGLIVGAFAAVIAIISAMFLMRGNI